MEPNTQYVINIWAYDTAGNKTSASETQITTAEAPAMRAKSVQFFGGFNTGNGTTGNNTDTDYSFDDFDFELAEKAVEIRDAYVVFEARIEAYADNSTDYTGYELAFDACESPCDADAWGGGAVSTEDAAVLAYNESESDQIRLLLNVTNEADLADYVGNGGGLTGEIGYRINTGSPLDSIAFAQASLVVTYVYSDDASTDITNTVIYPLESNLDGDHGTRRASTNDDCVKSPLPSSNCPLFIYTRQFRNIPLLCPSGSGCWA